MSERERVEDAIARRNSLVDALRPRAHRVVEKLETTAAESFRTTYTRVFDGCSRPANANLRRALVLLFQRHPVLLLPGEWVAEYLHKGAGEVAKWETEALAILLRDEPSSFGSGMMRICRALPLDPRLLLRKHSWGPYMLPRKRKPPA